MPSRNDEHESLAADMDNISWNSPGTTHVFAWLRALPADPMDFLPFDSPPDINLRVYEEYLLFSGEYGVKQTQKLLEECEIEYRRVGLAYHRMPLSVRDSLPNSQVLAVSSAMKPPLNPGIFQYLKILYVFPVERNSEHHFFKNWLRVENRILEIQNLISITSEDQAYLRSVCDEFEEKLDFCRSLINWMRRALSEVDRSVQIADQIAQLDQDESRTGSAADIADPVTDEGNAYRLWVSSFPEVASGRVTLDLAEQMLRLAGPEFGLDWKKEYKCSSEYEYADDPEAVTRADGA